MLRDCGFRCCPRHAELYTQLHVPRQLGGFAPTRKALDNRISECVAGNNTLRWKLRIEQTSSFQTREISLARNRISCEGLHMGLTSGSSLDRVGYA
eukprot:2322478-Pleurochrysis_carterae.AAC.4